MSKKTTTNIVPKKETRPLIPGKWSPSIPKPLAEKIIEQANFEGVKPQFIFIKWLEAGEEKFVELIAALKAASIAEASAN